MKKFDQLVDVSDDDITPSVNSYGKSSTPFVYSIVSVFLSVFPLINFAGVWLGVKAVEEYSWRNSKAYLGWFAITVNLLFIFFYSILVAYIFTIYPEFEDPCRNLAAGDYVTDDGAQFTCT